MCAVYFNITHPKKAVADTFATQLFVVGKYIVMDPFHSVVILKLKVWVETALTYTCTLNYTQSCYMSGSCSKSPKPLFNSKMVTASKHLCCYNCQCFSSREMLDLSFCRLKRNCLLWPENFRSKKLDIKLGLNFRYEFNINLQFNFNGIECTSICWQFF